MRVEEVEIERYFSNQKIYFLVEMKYTNNTKEVLRSVTRRYFDDNLLLY